MHLNNQKKRDAVLRRANVSCIDGFQLALEGFLAHKRGCSTESKEAFCPCRIERKIDSDGSRDKKIKVTLRRDWKVVPLFSIGASITGGIKRKAFSSTHTRATEAIPLKWKQ